jgi:adenosylmethionine-8-amino-7-oxononanoate aminotransferase
LVQGAAGMVMHEPEALAKLINICNAKPVLTIADEVMTAYKPVKTSTWIMSMHCQT